MTADVRMLQEQAQQLAITIAALNQALTESLKALNARLDQSNDATRKGFADQKLLIDNMGNDVRVIRERSDDTNVRIAALREELEALRATVQTLQAPPPPPAVIDPLDPNAPPAAVPSTQAPPVTPPPSTAGLSSHPDVRNRQGRLRRRPMVAGHHRVRAISSRVSPNRRTRTTRSSISEKQTSRRASFLKRLPHTIW
jgi:hypothetical protein